MEYISLAMMNKYGGGKKYGGMDIPINLEVSDLFVKIYELTAVPYNKYQMQFFTPEVLVKGNICASNIKMYNPVF